MLGDQAPGSRLSRPNAYMDEHGVDRGQGGPTTLVSAMETELSFAATDVERMKTILNSRGSFTSKELRELQRLTEQISNNLRRSQGIRDKLAGMKIEEI